MFHCASDDPQVIRVYQLLHARRRARQRYGLEFTREGIEALCAQIAAGQARSIGGGRYLLRISGRKVRVVFDGTTGAIATFLPPSRTGRFPMESTGAS